jgi:RNA polymerase sigma-70 factor (ECF subfamily)
MIGDTESATDQTPVIAAKTAIAGACARAHGPMPPREAAITELYRRHAAALHRRCASIVGNPDDARDLVHDAFARYLAAQGRWRDSGSAFAVLHRIASNAAIDRLRRQRTASQIELDVEAHASELDPGARRVDALHDLAVLTRGLSERELTIARLYHCDGHTQDGIAASLALSRRSIGKILTRFERHVRQRDRE